MNIKTYRKILFCVLALTTPCLWAQTLSTIVTTDGKVHTIELDKVNEITYERGAIFPLRDEWVDLGLPSGVLWRSCNFGASNPTESGTYFLVDDLSGDGSVYAKGKDIVFERTNREMRTPHYSEYEELLEYCTITQVDFNGVKGIALQGPSGASIFFPAVGFMADADVKFPSELGAYGVCKGDAQGGFSSASYLRFNPMFPEMTALNEPYGFDDAAKKPIFYCFREDCDISNMKASVPVKPVKDSDDMAPYYSYSFKWNYFSSQPWRGAIRNQTVIANRKPNLVSDADWVKVLSVERGPEVVEDIPEVTEDWMRFENIHVTGKFYKWFITFDIDANKSGERRQTEFREDREEVNGNRGRVYIEQAPRSVIYTNDSFLPDTSYVRITGDTLVCMLYSDDVPRFTANGGSMPDFVKIELEQGGTIPFPTWLEGKHGIAPFYAYKVTFIIEPNTSDGQRSAIISVVGNKHNGEALSWYFSQYPFQAMFLGDRLEMEGVDWQGATGTTTVMSNVKLEYEDVPDWLTLEIDNLGEIDDYDEELEPYGPFYRYKVTAIVSPNNTGNDRSCLLRASGYQNGFGAEISIWQRPKP